MSFKKNISPGAFGARSSTSSAEVSDIEWEDAPTELTRRSVFMQVYGETDTGRTSLALTAPGPIALIHAAEKVDGVVQTYAKGKIIRMFNFGCTLRGSQQDIANQASKVISQVKNALDQAFDFARTVIIDTHTDLWELLRLARFGTLTPQGQIASMYGPVNAEWAAMMRKFRHQDRASLIAIGKIRERYRKDKPTGIMEQAGHKDMDTMADVVIKTSRATGGGFVAKIQKGWFNAHSEGIEIEGDDIRFSYLMSLISGIDEEEWS